MHKRLFPFLICIALIGCKHHIKTYHPNGKIATEYTEDHEHKKNGIFKVYDINGNLDCETYMIHDTISGIIKYYYESGEVEAIQNVEKGLYNISIEDSDFIPKIQYFSFEEMHHYNKNGTLKEYNYVTVKKHDRFAGIKVKYENDSISEIYGAPIVSVSSIQDESTTIKLAIVAVPTIPKCKRNFFVLDLADSVVGSCIGCDSLGVILDFSKSYAIKIEYIDSAFHVKHSVIDPLIKVNKKRFPHGLESYWKREGMVYEENTRHRPHLSLTPDGDVNTIALETRTRDAYAALTAYGNHPQPLLRKKGGELTANTRKSGSFLTHVGDVIGGSVLGDASLNINGGNNGGK